MGPERKTKSLFKKWGGHSELHAAACGTMYIFRKIQVLFISEY